jgi:hypothetical protein
VILKLATQAVLKYFAPTWVVLFAAFTVPFVFINKISKKSLT